MCGINGSFAYHYAANPVDRAELVAVRDQMAARGPDGSGLWLSSDERVGFGHRRLAIIDLTDAGQQPMMSADGRLVVTFNGEIYNYQELRKRLVQRGHHFRSESDTEVLLQLYADKGPEMVHDLRGMFAFSIWDAERRSLFLARDPYGIKPLYYADDGWTFRFASQVKALLAARAISRDPEPAGIVGFHLFGSVPEPFTTYSAIQALPAGTTLTVDRLGAGDIRRYHSIAKAFATGQTNSPAHADAAEAVRAALLDSVTSHLVSDVSVGAFLSAGIDSGALVGLMRDAAAPRIKTVTIAFEEFRGRPEDEATLARQVAGLYQTDHLTRIVTEREFASDLPRIMDAMDQPSIDGVNTWFVAKAARERGLKVAISGLGGDELFGGYPSFRNIPKWVRWAQGPSRVPFLGRVLRSVGAPLTGMLGLNPKSAGIVEYGGSYAGAYMLQRGLRMPWELSAVLDRDIVRQGLRRLVPQQLIANEIASRPSSSAGCVGALESTLYMRNQLLRDTDWASMAHSIEVRVPLVDRVLLDRIAPLTMSPALDGKRLLANAPSLPLPAAVVSRPKTGFTTPIQRWMETYTGSHAKCGSPWARDWSIEVQRMCAVAAL